MTPAEAQTIAENFYKIFRDKKPWDALEEVSQTLLEITSEKKPEDEPQPGLFLNNPSQR